MGYGLQLHESRRPSAVDLHACSGPIPRILRESQPRHRRHRRELLIEQLERRLDNVAFRLGFAISRRQARQAVSPRASHGERPQGQHSRVPGERGRRDRRPRQRQETADLEQGTQFAAQNPVPAVVLEVNFEICPASNFICPGALTLTCRSTLSRGIATASEGFPSCQSQLPKS